MYRYINLAMYEYMRLFVYEFALFHFNFHGKAVISCSWPSKHSVGNITNPFRFLSSLRYSALVVVACPLTLEIHISCHLANN